MCCAETESSDVCRIMHDLQNDPRFKYEVDHEEFLKMITDCDTCSFEWLLRDHIIWANNEWLSQEDFRLSKDAIGPPMNCLFLLTVAKNNWSTPMLQILLKYQRHRFNLTLHTPQVYCTILLKLPYCC